jgi:ribosomal protein L14
MVGDIIKVSVVSKSPHKKVIKNKIYLALIITSKKIYTRCNGIFIFFGKSRVIMLNDQLKFLGTRYRGIVSKEIYKYKKKIFKIISLAKFVL